MLSPQCFFRFLLGLMCIKSEVLVPQLKHFGLSASTYMSNEMSKGRQLSWPSTRIWEKRTILFNISLSKYELGKGNGKSLLLSLYYYMFIYPNRSNLGDLQLWRKGKKNQDYDTEGVNEQSWWQAFQLAHQENASNMNSWIVIFMAWKRKRCISLL